MRKQAKYVLLMMIFPLLYFSCQRELNFENDQVSAGLLQSDITGDCLPKNVAGTYIQEKVLGDTNYIEVTVNVTNPGPYLISTDTINGYSFKGAGSFSAPGPVIVKLSSQGKPITAGNDNFTVKYGASHCLIRVTVTPPEGVITPAIFTLQGAPGICIPATVSGSYIKDRALTPEDTVSIGLKVTKPGSYTISTNTLNGYSFSGTGVLADTGLQTISLTATGSPLAAGINNFTVNVASGCSFSITVTTAVVVTGTDYFPLTKNSYWVYDNLLNPGDSVKRIITDTVRINNKLYQVMEEHDMYGGNILYDFRKDGSAYFEYGSLDKYTASFSYSPRLFGEFLFLKENIGTGDGWNTGEFSGTFSGGQTIFLQYNFYCANANAAVVLNGNSFINVYKIRVYPQVRSKFGPLNSTGEIIDMYYASGVGLIYIKVTKDGFSSIELQIRNWKVY